MGGFSFGVFVRWWSFSDNSVRVKSFGCVCGFGRLVGYYSDGYVGVVAGTVGVRGVFWEEDISVVGGGVAFGIVGFLA